LEVFDREKKQGFSMAAMAAKVRYEASADVYVASYLSASLVAPESIPAAEEHRLRFCPPSARARLLRGPDLGQEAEEAATSPEQEEVEVDEEDVGEENDDEKAPSSPSWDYPYKVLQGVEEELVAPGTGVELQWKMQFGSPFGWWYGRLESLRRDNNGETATATLIFPHFPSTSAWYRLEVRFGDAKMRPCTFGGYTGGVRMASPEEHALWMRFFPAKLVEF
jgi:hypothetical protein